ncbi:MAG: hypothetical protein Q7R52_04955 [archaeon]|nr:hypothetical protein [archaeon]
MLNKKEIISMLAITLIIGFAVSMFEGWNAFKIATVFIFFVILINVFAKKITAYFLDSEIEVGIWEMERFGFKPHQRFNKPFIVGAIFPILSKIIFFPFKNFVWMASLIYEVKPKVYHAAKRHGLYTFSEMTEYHIGLIAAAGVFASLIGAVIGYLAGYPEFSRLSIYYAFFSMLPFSDLDGNKIFFGSLILWSFLAAVTLIAMGYAFLLV